MQLGSVARNLNPKRILGSLIARVADAGGISNDPEHNVAKRFSNVLRVTKNIKSHQYAKAYRAVQVVCRHLEGRQRTETYIVSDTLGLIDDVVGKDSRALHRLCDAIKDIAKINDTELYAEFSRGVRELLGRNYGKNELGEAIRSLGHRIVDAYTTIGQYLPGQEIDPSMIGIGTVVLQLSSDPKHDMQLIARLKAEGTSLSSDFMRRYYGSGRRFVYQIPGLLGGGMVDPFSENKDVYKGSPKARDQYIESMRYASTENRVAGIISLFSYSANHPSIDSVEGLARRVAKLPSYYDPELVKLRDRLGKFPAAELLYSQLIDCISDDSLVEAHRVSITKLALLADPEELSTVIGLISEVLDLEDVETKTALFLKIEGHVKEKDRNVRELFREVFRASLGEFAIKYPEKPIEEVRDQFLNHPALSERVTPEELDIALKQYERYLEHRESLAFDPVSVLTDKLEELKRRKDTSAEQYFAVFAEIFRKAYGLYPFNTQILTCLLQLSRAHSPNAHGVYAQVETGEGKSIDFAFLAAYYAVTGQKVDIVSFNEYLSERDSERFKEFYTAVGATSGAFTHDDIGSDDFDKIDIIYSTHTAMVLHYLQHGLRARHFLDNQPRIGLVDEADSLLLDNHESKARIAGPAFKRRPSDFAVDEYREALRYAKQHKDQIAEGGVDTISIQDFRQKMARFGRGGANRSDTDYLVLLHFSFLALDLQKGHHYIVRMIDDKEQVEILDSDNTGRRVEGSQWSYGLHELVSVKEGLEPPRPQSTFVEHSHHTFFRRRYSKILCLSGTLGDSVDRQELDQLYDLSGFDVPPHRVSKRSDAGLKLLLDEDSLNSEILNRVQQMVHEGRPVLLVANDVNESEALHAMLSLNGFFAQILDDVDNRIDDGTPATEGEIINRAGEPGHITIATNTAGRGTDITVTKESADNGGLHVIITFVPVNTRVERQVRGRAGRQGNPGSCEVLALVDSGGFMDQLTDLESKLLRSVVTSRPNDGDLHTSIVQLLRELHGLGTSAIELYKVPYEDRHDKVIETFFQIFRETMEAIKKKEDLPADNAYYLRRFIVDEWADVYDGYDREKALSEIRLSNFVARAMKGDMEHVNVQAFELKRAELRTMYEQKYRSHHLALDSDCQGLINEIIDEWTLKMTVGQSNELYQGCNDYIARLEEVAQRACKDCMANWKKIIREGKEADRLEAQLAA